MIFNYIFSYILLHFIDWPIKKGKEASTKITSSTTYLVLSLPRMVVLETSPTPLHSVRLFKEVAKVE